LQKPDDVPPCRNRNRDKRLNDYLAFLLWERAMPHADFALNSMVFVADRPRCPWCGEPMWLVRVLETGPRLSERRFECAACDMAKDVWIEHN
jgi:hypothetical protein